MIFDPAFKPVIPRLSIQTPQRLFSIVHLSRVEYKVLVPVLTIEIDNLVGGQHIYKSAWTHSSD